jgi:hypothetical protein
MFRTIRRVLNVKARKETEIKFYKTMTIPTLTCSSETPTVTKRQKQKDRKSKNEISSTIIEGLCLLCGPC